MDTRLYAWYWRVVGSWTPSTLFTNKYEDVEKLLLPITAKIEAIKIKITREYVPEKYNSQKYMWNYGSSGNCVHC